MSQGEESLLFASLGVITMFINFVSSLLSIYYCFQEKKPSVNLRWNGADCLVTRRAVRACNGSGTQGDAESPRWLHKELLSEAGGHWAGAETPLVAEPRGSEEQRVQLQRSVAVCGRGAALPRGGLTSLGGPPRFGLTKKRKIIMGCVERSKGQRPCLCPCLALPGCPRQGLLSLPFLSPGTCAGTWSLCDPVFCMPVSRTRSSRGCTAWCWRLPRGEKPHGPSSPSAWRPARLYLVTSAGIPELCRGRLPNLSPCRGDLRLSSSLKPRSSLFCGDKVEMSAGVAFLPQGEGSVAQITSGGSAAV
ncbi:uncharacterized protein LOC121077700 [Cygnus olor]|uniref:uncharacterized protein LOC121077700 n=1 Tax=Cygnus olor TaxID=8869 RepID=UPI001ADEA857|nr:uncharacterized protein LOC121077700 [Cygnus olor]